MKNEQTQRPIRLSVAVAAKTAPPDAFVVWRGFEQSFEKAARLGYQGVELALKSGDEISPDLLDHLLCKNNLQVSCISSGQVFATLGLSCTDPDESVRRRTVDVFKGLVDLAGDFGGLVNIGRARGSYHKGQPSDETERLFVEAARSICDYGASRGVTLILEPVNRYETNFVNSLEEGAAILKKVARENIGLMPDVFHMNIEDDQIGGAIAKFGSLVRYVHIADSNRRAPSSGHLDFADVFRGLREARFRGWLSVEILPVPNGDQAAEKAARIITPMIDRYNVDFLG